MKASDLLQEAVAMIERQPSPWRPELVLQLNKLVRAARLHESWSGYSPRVEDYQMPADAALEVLEGGG